MRAFLVILSIFGGIFARFAVVGVLGVVLVYLFAHPPAAEARFASAATPALVFGILSIFTASRISAILRIVAHVKLNDAAPEAASPSPAWVSPPPWWRAPPLQSAALPNVAERFEPRPFLSPNEPSRLALADEDGSKTWAHIIEGHAKHRDRKPRVGPDGRIVRRHLLVLDILPRSTSSLVGPGTEGTKLGARLKIGKTRAAEPSPFIDWKRGLLAMGKAEARRVGLSWDSVKRAKRTLRRTGTLRDGHGGRFLSRLKIALATG